MARIVLISPPYLQDYMRNARCDFVSLSKSNWFPIWLGQAGSWLEAKGHKTRLMDAQVAGLTKEQAFDEIRAFGPDVVAVYTGRLSEESDLAFADEVAATGRTVALVGPYASIDPRALLAKARRARIAIKGEFDLPLEELADGKAPQGLAGFVIRDEQTGEIVGNAERPLYKSDILAQFPSTAAYFHRQLDVARYKTPSEPHPFVDVMSGRGCAWGRCNFCLWVQTFVPGSVYNLRPIEQFMEEFEYVTRFMPEVRGIMIQDDMLTRPRAAEISEAILERGYKIQWSCYAKPNSRLDQATFELMRRAGCLNLHVGFESGDDEVLERIDKGATVAQSREFVRLAHAAGLNIHGDFAMGHLGETKESMQRTIDLARELDPHTAQFQVMIPFQGTIFQRQLDELGAWSPSGEPDYSASGGASSEEIRATAKSGYRQFYFSRSYLQKIVSRPREYFFNRFDQYARAIPAVTWRRWVK